MTAVSCKHINLPPRRRPGWLPALWSGTRRWSVLGDISSLTSRPFPYSLVPPPFLFLFSSSPLPLRASPRSLSDSVGINLSGRKIQLYYFLQMSDEFPNAGLTINQRAGKGNCSRPRAGVFYLDSSILPGIKKKVTALR